MFDASQLDALQRIGFNDAVQTAAAALDDGSTRLARVVERHRDRLILHDGNGLFAAGVKPAWLQQDALASVPIVGDWVLWRADGAEGLASVEALLPRRNLISRGRSNGETQALVANVDTVLLLMGLDGNFSPNRLDRFLTLALASKAQAVVLLTKADAVPEAAERFEQLRQRVSPEIPVLATDTRSPAILEALAPWTGRGSTLVLLGSSGVGKSTLGNTLLGEPLLRTGSVSAMEDRGRHTTVSRRLLPLPGGGCLIDTPGIREVGLTGDEPPDASAFDDLQQLAAQCRYRNCRHEQEPGCKVRKGTSPERLENFRKLLREQTSTPSSTAAARSRAAPPRREPAEARRYDHRRDEPE